MLDKAKLGTRYTCFKCGTKFYDLNRPTPSCPECQADQREAPARDLRALLGKGGPVKKYADEEESEVVDEPGEDDDDLNNMGLDDEDDDDGDMEVEDDDEMGGDEGGGGGDDDE